MSRNIFLDSAHKAVEESFKAHEAGQHVRSWALTGPARVFFGLDAVTQVASAAMAAVWATCGVPGAVFTWGKNTSLLRGSLTDLDQSAGRVMCGATGAVVSPSLACEIEKASGGSGATMLGAVFAVLLAITPSDFSYNRQIGWTHIWRR